MKRTAVVWTLALVATVAAAAFAETEAERFLFGPFRSAAMERAPGHLDRAARAVEMEALQQRLAADAVAGARQSPLVVEADALALAEVAAGAPQGRYPVGVNQAAGREMSLAHLAGSDLRRFEVGLPFGALRGGVDGGFVWTGLVRSPGASALRLHLTGFDLAPGMELWVYNRSGQAFGPYTARGPQGEREVWTHTIYGDELTMQLVGPAGADLARARFTVAEVGHLTARFLQPFQNAPRFTPESVVAPEAFCSYNAPCVENLACSSPPPAVAQATGAIADMLFASGRYYYICTGGLVADTDLGSQIPYFLTANHCISKGREANSLETYFDYTTSCNSPDCTAPFDQGPRQPDTLGATIVSANRTSDYTLLQLAGNPPAGSVFLGWNSAPVAFSNGTHLYRISHPAGAPQAYSAHDVDTSKGTCSSWPRGNWIYSQDVFGATEGGSSGSPVLNGAGEIVGQLSGACGTNVNDSCDSVNNATVDGAFAAYFSAVEQYLDPQAGGGCTPTEPTEVSCSNGLDDDCDGLIDALDPDCQGGSCTPVGQHCTNDSDCCSNNCSNGRPSSRVCQ